MALKIVVFTVLLLIVLMVLGCGFIMIKESKKISNFNIVQISPSEERAYYT